MSRRAFIGVLALAAFLLVAIALLTPGAEDSGPSVRSTMQFGLSSGFAYLDRRHQPVLAFEKPFSELPDPPQLLVIAEPLTAFFSLEDAAALTRWLQKGGRLLLLSSSRRSSMVPELGPGRLCLQLAVRPEAEQAEPPWGFEAYKAWRLATLDGRTTGEGGLSDLTFRTRIQGLFYQSPPQAKILVKGTNQAPLVFSFRIGRGKVVVVNNSSAFGNALLWEAGNLALWEDLIATQAAGLPILFDEFHHGHQALTAEGRTAALSAFELLAAHLLLLYLAAAYCLSRPFGPRFAARQLPTSSVGTSLAALAGLHSRGRHSIAAGQQLLSAARKILRGDEGSGPALPKQFQGGEKELLSLARSIGRRQRERRPSR